MKLTLLALAFGLALATPVLADPCKAIPDHGPAPANLRPGATFAGRVVHIIDGDGLCVATGAGSANWVEVRLADFYAPELSEPDGPRAKAALSRIALGRTVSCTAERQSYDRMISFCTLSGASLGDRMRASGIPEGGRGR